MILRVSAFPSIQAKCWNGSSLRSSLTARNYMCRMWKVSCRWCFLRFPYQDSEHLWNWSRDI